MSRLGNDDATIDESASALFSHAWTRPRAAVATSNSAHTRRGARQLNRVRRVVPRPGATRYRDHTRLCCMYECTHVAYTWPRTETSQRTNQATNQPACSVNKDNDIEATTTRPTPNHARHATPTRPRHRRPARLEVPKTLLVCVPKTPFRCTFCVVVIFLSLSIFFSSGSSYRLPSFLFSGSSFFLGLPRVTCIEG